MEILGCDSKIIATILILLAPPIVLATEALDTEVLATEKADFVYVDKSEAKLYLTKNGKIIKEYKVAFGANPDGHKIQEGDNRTPEGLYLLDFKNENSDFHKSIHISYPNRDDRRRARELGVDPGGDIMIHGLRKDLEQYAYIMQDYNWTNGCIALTNQDVEELWASVDVPTPIRINP